MALPTSLLWMLTDRDLVFSATDIGNRSWNCVLGYRHGHVANFFVIFTGPEKPTLLEILQALCRDFEALNNIDELDGRTLAAIIAERDGLFQFVKECTIAQIHVIDFM